MEGISKKLSIRTFISIYAISFLLHSLFFIDFQKVSAAGGGDRTNIVAVIVDKDIYPTIQQDVERYTTAYMQSKLDNTKAIVLPINIKNIGAPEITKMLENLYFDGIKDTPSKLEGILLIGNIPLPVIQDNGFIFPSIYPYVDFEDQQYVYDQNKRFFIPNDNPNGQAEVRHGIINFTGTNQYHDYFSKLKTYNQDPETFAAPEIWYDDFVGLKKYYINENTDYYINNQLFAEDKGYRRYNNLMLNTIKGEYTSGMMNIGSGIQNEVADSDSPELKTYADMVQSKQDAATATMAQMANSKTPTMVISKTINEMSKTYDGLLSTQFLTKIQDNVQSAGRRYAKNASGNWMNNIASHWQKIVQKDNWILGNDNLQPLLIQFNNALESGLNDKIATEKYAMKYPVPVRYEAVDYYLLVNTKSNIYENFYYGKNALTFSNVEDASIYRGTFQNLNSLDNINLTGTKKSIGGSYQVFSQQVEANRGYNLLNTEAELTLRSGAKQYLLQKKDCNGLGFLPGSEICIGTQVRDTTYGDNHDFTDMDGNNVAEDTKESPMDFAFRLRGGASPINLNTSVLQQYNRYELSFYNYLHAVSPIYDIAGSQRTTQNHSEANSYLAIKQDASMIKTADQSGPIPYPRAVKTSSFSSPVDHGIRIGDKIFVPKDIKPYTDVDFFSIFQNGNGRTNTPGQIITLKRSSSPNGSGYSDYNDFKYKLIDTSKKNISPTAEEISGMNLTTADRPIDSIRNITFQGIGGDVVQFNYPDLYQVDVYKTVGTNLVLKNETEILTALKDYLETQVVNYNGALTTQQNRKTQYYQTHTAAFNFLSQVDPTANPNRNYTLLPTDFLIKQLITSLDNLVQSYGKSYVYGDLPNNTDDEKLMLIAKLLLYQNSAWAERKTTSTVIDDMKEIKNAFNINEKISSTVNNYLQSDNNKGTFLSPTYNSTGYEVAYINSDGADLIDTSETPAFIKQLKDIKEQKTEATRVANKILAETQKTELETSIDDECGVDTDGTALLFDLKTFKSPWFTAMKCWTKKIIKEPFKIKVSFNSAQGPTLANAFQDISESVSSRGTQWKDIGADAQTSSQAANDQAMQDASPAIQSRLQIYNDFAWIKTSATSRFVDSTEAHTVTIGSDRELTNTTVTVSATGDACLGIQENGKTVSSNLCQTPVNFSLTKDPKTYTFTTGNKKAGSMAIKTKLCIAGSSHCNTKTQTIHILPGAVNKVQLQPATTIMMAGAEMPIIIKAQDANGNTIGQVVENYDFLTETGTVNGNQKTSFNNFSKANFIYQAPATITENTPITIKVKGTNQSKQAVSFEQKIIIAKGILNVSYLNQIVFSSNISQSRSIGRQLPAAQTDLVKKDANNIAQVQEAAIPKISIALKDKNNNALDNVLTVTSKNNLLTPGYIQERAIELSGQNKVQRVFQPQSNVMVSDGKADIRLYPTLKAGKEELVLQMPGLDPITIIVNVYPGSAQKVLITQTDTTLTTNDLTQGEIQVVDYRNNPVTNPTVINIGAIGPGTINGQASEDITRTGSTITYTLKGKSPGGNGNIFAYIKNLPLTDQEPATQQFFVQNNVLPETNMNVMYLNLFGSDRGNQRGYFSDNKQKVNELTQTSNKLLTTTTELIDPTKIKQITVIVSPDGQIQNMSEGTSTLRIEAGQVRNEITDIGKVSLGTSANYQVIKLDTITALSSRAKNENAFIYIPETTDSIITGNEIANKKVIINGLPVIDFGAGKTDLNILIQANGENSNGLTHYDVIYNDTKVGTLVLYKKDQQITANSITIQDRTKYATDNVFTNGSTNGAMGIAIYDIQSAFTKNGYQSIEDSNDPLLGIGFTSKFKNISYFAGGQNVGESTLPYGSAFLINFGDPLVERVSKSINVSKTNTDGSVGQAIFSNPNKTIFQTIPADINNDGLQDLVIAYTDGSIQLLKNYGGKKPYENLGNLMLIADTIKEIKVADVNNDNYPDIIIQTNADKLIVYKNNKGIFEVDGTPVCLNTNVADNEITSTPNDLGGVHQTFLEDMNQDGNMDIITNDIAGDVKIFYGGADSHGHGYYLSTMTGVCDDGWFDRQKNNYQTVKRFGLQVKSDWLITDASLVHYKGMEVPDETLALTDTETPEADTEIDSPAKNEDGSDFTTGQASDVASSLVSSTAQDIVTSAKDFDYTDNPLKKAPIYETLPANKVMFLPISRLSGEKVSIYKTYTDINGGTLADGDSVRIMITILSLQNNNKITYLDELKGPRIISKNKANEISGFALTGTLSPNLKLSRDADTYQFMLDNIVLQNNQSLSISYPVTYKQGTLTQIKVEDEATTAPVHNKDGYPDISIMSTDPCLKARHIARNTKSSSEGYKEYQDIFEDLDQKVSDYSSGAWTAQEDQLDASFTQLDSISSQSLTSLPGVSEILESTSVKDLFSNMTNGGINLSLNMGFIDDITADISKKLDEGLKGLCQGFKLGKPGCSGVPVPFNQAFLAPGDYHIFGCVPKAPNPLSIVFKVLNKTLGKGLPLLAFPTDNVIPVWPPSPSGAGGIFGGSTSQFRLYIAPTMTLGMGIAICVGPYGVGAKLPKPIRDIAGNCIVFAIPGAMLPCNSDNSQNDTSDSKGADELDPSFVNAADNGACTNPPAVGNKITFVTNNIISSNDKGTSSPLQAIETQGTVSNPLVPQGNFGGLIQIDQEPTIESSEETSASPTDTTIDIKAGTKTSLKILGGKTKGLIKCIIQDWMTRQVKYIINNITKMHIQVNLPDMSTMVQGFDKLGNLSDIYKQLNAQDVAGGTQSTTQITKGNVLTGLKQQFSRQQRSSISKKVGQNPFEALALMFKEVPLININTKDINVKIPALTSDEITKYGSYLQSWIEKNAKIVEDRSSVINQLVAMCGTTNKAEATQMKADLQAIQTTDATTKKWINDQIKDLNIIIGAKDDTTRQQLGSDRKNIGVNVKNATKKLTALPYWKTIQITLSGQKTVQGSKFPATQQVILDRAGAIVTSLGKCSDIIGSVDGFISFKTNTDDLVKSVQENIKVLDQYKQFPGQLYEWIHITDRYLGEISSITSEFVGGITSWLNTNANRFSQYVDAITLIIGAIKTWQAIIDFSINRSEKCSKCSNDNYGSFSCSLSFLCPQLPVFKIPPFKIPDITLDVSHLELGVDILLPKFNFVPIKIPLPELPSLPEPPTADIDVNIDINIFKSFSLPNIPVLPGPPQLPELPSFLPNVEMKLPVLPPAPKIPNIMPSINGVLKVANFIGKVFCIVKGGIGLVGEKGVKAKIEQLTQRTWNVPVFDFFNLTSKYKDPPQEGFDYEIDAYARLKYNFDGVYTLLDNIVQSANDVVSKTVEAPIQSGMNQLNDKINNNSVVDTINTVPAQNVDVNLNINGYLPANYTGGTDYAEAYKTMQKELAAFRQQSNLDKKTLAALDTIDRTIHAESKVTPATKELNEAKAMADGIVNQSRKEVQGLANEVKSYDTFIKKVEANTVKLVSANNLQTSISAPLITMNESTKQMIASQESPTKTYIALNKTLVNGYVKAMENSSATDLNMTNDVYKKSKTYLTTLQERIAFAETAQSPGQSATTPQAEKTLLASSCIGGNCQTNTLDENGYKQDLSSYVQGVFVETGTLSGNVMVNVVNNATLIAQVGKNYRSIDMNNDKKDDMLMRDQNTIYVKYANQNNEYLSKGGNHISTNYTRYFDYNGPGGKWRIDNSKDLDALDNGYASFGNIEVKLRDHFYEVKNFKTQGQSYDDLLLTWKNNKALGEDIQGYVIKFTYKVDNFFEKIQTFNFFGTNTTDTKYIIVLPQGTNYATGLVTIDNISKKPLKALLTGTVLAVNYFDPNQDSVSVNVTDMPRKRLYAEIASLDQDPSQLSNTQRDSFALFIQGSPWSNQIVAGNQLIGDTQGPDGTITLRRVLTNDVISTGNAHEGFINTNYMLSALRQDNAAVTDMSIWKDDAMIYHRTGNIVTGTISIPNMFFTGTDKQTYVFIASDANGNLSKETVNLNINIPKIEITDVHQIDSGNAEIIAKIEQDLDEGLVSFQRERNGIIRAITGTQANTLGGYELKPGKTTITGGIMSLGNMLALYSPTGEEMGTIDPTNGKITITDNWENQITIKLDFLLHIPTIKILRTTDQAQLFQISLPGKKLNKITMLQGKPNYEVITLSDKQFGAFEGGYCIRNSSSECILYTNTNGKMYIPSVYASTLGGTYGFDDESQSITYTVTDRSNKPIVTFFLQTKNLLNK